MARPGHIQSVFSSGEIDPGLDTRFEQKAFNGGLRWAENVEFVPQGGFRLGPRTVHIGDLPATASKIMPFTARDGTTYDLVFHDHGAKVWSATAEIASISTPWGTDLLPALTWTQQLDTAILFHADVSPRRILRTVSGSWTIGVAPIENVPSYDYGASYSNGIPAEWEIEMIGFGTEVSGSPVRAGIVWKLTVSKQDTSALQIVVTGTTQETVDRDATAARIRDAVLALPNVADGVEVYTTGSDWKYRIVFAGAGNTGDDWAVSGTVFNRSDVAIVAFHKVLGVAPGEPIISDARGWPRCGLFFQQRLLMGGLKSLPNTWMYSVEGRYYNFDRRVPEAGGSAFVPMDVDGGEAIVGFFASRFLNIFTSKGEYWLVDRAISKTSVPNHVQASGYGSTEGVAIVESEGAALFIQKDGHVVGEFRFTDVNGNYGTQAISLVSAHLMSDILDHAVQRERTKGSGNRHTLVRADGDVRLGTLLREQEITAYGRWTTDGAVKAVVCNGRNELSLVVERHRGTTVMRSYERFDDDALLDAAVTVALSPASATVTGLGLHEGRTVWAIADGDVFGPFVVASGTITLPRPAAAVTVGRWSPPIVETLPLTKLVTQSVWVARKTRIHTVRINVQNTTSIAVAANFVRNDPDTSPLDLAAGRIFDVPLKSMGQAADVGELDAPYTGWITVPGLKGYVDEATVLITQTRPGRLHVKSIVAEATHLG